MRQRPRRRHPARRRRGERFGGDKLLATALATAAPLGDVRACRNLLAAAVDDVVAVVRPATRAWRERSRAAGARVVGCADAGRRHGREPRLRRARGARRRAAGSSRSPTCRGFAPRPSPRVAARDRRRRDRRGALPSRRARPSGRISRSACCGELAALSGDEGAKAWWPRTPRVSCASTSTIRACCATSTRRRISGAETAPTCAGPATCRRWRSTMRRSSSCSRHHARSCGLLRAGAR